MRLAHDTIRLAGAPVRIRFEGRDIQALQGETVAAALSAAGIVAFRRTASGVPRGVHCGMGACFDCVVTINGRAGQRACLTTVTDGMEISGEPPASPALLVPIPDGEDAPERTCDVLVVGAGPAGLSAAIAAAEAGAAVVVLDERDAVGGQFHKPLAASHAHDAPDAQLRQGAALRRRADAAGVGIETNAVVWGAFGAQEIAAVVAGIAVTFRPRRLVLAPGAHERPVPLPGWTLPGVMTTGALQTLVRSQRVVPGHRVLVAGNGPLNFQLAGELLDSGVRVAAVVEAAPRPGLAALGAVAALCRNDFPLLRQGLSALRRLRRGGVKVLWGSRVLALEGDARVEAARIATPAGERRVHIDTVALNLGVQPEVGLARALDVPQRFVDTGLGHLASETDAVGRTEIEGVYAVGDGASVGGAHVAMARGRLAGLAAARDLGLLAPDEKRTRAALKRAEDFQTALWSLFRPPPPEPPDDATTLCRCEEVTAGRLRAEIAGGLRSLAALKRATRAGMGRCQGRFCAASIARLCPDPPDPESFAAPRLPIRPVPAGALMFEAPEFDAPLLTAPTPPAYRVPVAELPVEHRHAGVAVIGAGAIGLSTAYFLARAGADVLVIDRDEAGLAASTANAGSLHVQLLSSDYEYEGMPEDGGPAAHSMLIAPRSIALWKDIAAEAGETLGIATKGGLLLADTEMGLRWLRAKQKMEQRWGIETHMIGPNEVHSLAPTLSPDLLGAVFCPLEGRIDPLRATMALSRLAQQRGARLLRGAEVVSIARENAAWRVRTTRGTVTVGQVVNCAGASGARIGDMVGLALPVTGTVQQVIVTEPAPKLVEHLVALAHRHLSLKQQDSGGLLLGGGWFGAYDPRDGRTSTLRRNIQGNLWVGGRVMPALRGLSILRCWTGIAPQVDRAPLLGEVPGLPGFFNAIAANGITLGPVAGQITAEAVLGREAPDPRYTLQRFEFTGAGTA